MPELKTKRVPRLQSEYKTKVFTPGSLQVLPMSVVFYVLVTPGKNPISLAHGVVHHL